MVQECVHLLPNGCKCRRIPKRGQKLCPAHQSRRRRATFEENDAFVREMNAFVDRLVALPLPALLGETVGLLAEIRLLVDRYASRRNRLALNRVTAAVTVAGDRLAETLRDPVLNPSPRSIPARPPSAPHPPQRLTPEIMARIEQVEAILNSGRQFPAQELEDLIRELDACTP